MCVKIAEKYFMKIAESSVAHNKLLHLTQQSMLLFVIISAASLWLLHLQFTIIGNEF